MAASFDFPAFRAAYEARNTAAWLAFFAEDAEWIEYRPDQPACHRRTIGRAAIGEFLAASAKWPEVLSVEEPEIDTDRIRFRAWLDHPGGRRMIEHVMLLTAEGRISRQVDVEVWDQPREETMEASNVVRMRVKPGFEKEFLEAHERANRQDWPGMRSVYLVKTGERDYCVVGEWDSMEALAAGRPQMIALLDQFRHMLEDLGNGLGVTDPVSGEIVMRMKSRQPA